MIMIIELLYTDYNIQKQAELVSAMTQSGGTKFKLK
jgi:hypothetical protein